MGERRRNWRALPTQIVTPGRPSGRSGTQIESHPQSVKPNLGPVSALRFGRDDGLVWLELPA